MAVQRPIKSLSELMDGGVEERFNFEMDKIWQNVQDPNTDPKAKREINIKITVRPNERRDSADFDVSVIPKLAPFKPLSKTVTLQFNGDGSVVATERTEQIPGQMKMDGSEQPLGKVVRFDSGTNN
ncbi:MAG: hypothetical protein IJG86_01955 [Clostridia bacterium]|nr:hypothetical protein [Clostridia bacterium]